MVAILLATQLGWILADPIIALFVAAVLVGSAWLVFRQSLDQLMDHELPDADRQRIIAIIHGHPDVRALHELKTRRQAGLSKFIQVRISNWIREMKLACRASIVVSDAVEAVICAPPFRAPK